MHLSNEQSSEMLTVTYRIRVKHRSQKRIRKSDSNNDPVSVFTRFKLSQQLEDARHEHGGRGGGGEHGGSGGGGGGEGQVHN